MNITAYEELRDFMHEVSPFVYCPEDEERTYCDYFDFLALLATNQEATAHPFHISLCLEDVVDKLHIYGFISGNGNYYSTKIVEGTDNLPYFISSHIPKDKLINKNSILVEKIKGSNSWHGLKFFINKIDSNSIFHGLSLLHEYFGRKNDMRCIPDNIFHIQNANVSYEKLEFVRGARSMGMLYQPDLHRIEIKQFLNEVYSFIHNTYPDAMALDTFSLKFPFNFGVGKHWFVLVIRNEMVEFYTSGVYVSRYAQLSSIYGSAIDAMTKRMAALDSVYLDTDPETLTRTL